MNTGTSIATDNLSVAEKIILMERLWDELSRSPTEVESPDWHADILDDRRAALRDGKTVFVEWDAAKKRLRERLQNPRKVDTALKPLRTNR